MSKTDDRFDVIIDSMNDLNERVIHLTNLVSAHDIIEESDGCYFCGDEASYKVQSDDRILALCSDHDPALWQDDSKTN